MNNKKLEKIKPILKEVKENLQKMYKSNLKSIILYGSYARGDATDLSDIDLLVVLQDSKEPVAERKKYLDLICELDLKYDTVISVLTINEDQFKTRKLPTILNAKKEGIII